MIDLYDSEIIELEKVLEILNRKRGVETNMEGFRQEVLDRFHKEGFIVDVKVFDTTQGGTYAFDVEIIERVDPIKEFDHDRLRHEIVSNLLNIPGGGGIIKASKADVQKALEQERKKHKHG